MNIENLFKCCFCNIVKKNKMIRRRLFGRGIDEDEMMPMGTSLIDAINDQMEDKEIEYKENLRNLRMLRRRKK